MSGPAKGVSPRADFVAAIAWIAFGSAIVAGSLAMDRMERFGAAVYTAPGLMPGILGVLIVLLGGILLYRSVRRGAVAGFAQPWQPGAEGRSVLARSAIAIGVTLVYTILLVGHGIPFWLASVVFVFAFLLIFYLPERRARGETTRGTIVAAIVAIATSAVVTFVFERIFLVRMP